MTKFEELNNHDLFSVGVWEMKPVFGSEEFVNKYIFNAYIQGLKFSFVKTGDKTCKELFSGVEFNFEEISMINDETGLSFFGKYVNAGQLKNIADREYTLSYFEAARKLNKSDKKLIKK